MKTSPGEQIDASEVDSYTKSMFFSDFGPFFNGCAIVLTDGRTDKPSNEDAKMHLKRTIVHILSSHIIK